MQRTCSKHIEKKKSISVHVPKHLKPVNHDKFRHYLTDLINVHLSSITTISYYIIIHKMLLL